MTEEHIAAVQFETCGKAYYFNSSAFPHLRVDDYVVVTTSRGRQIGRVVSFVDGTDEARQYKPIQRIANPRDLVSQQIWQAKAEEALKTCIDKAASLGSFEHVKFLKAEYNFDGSLLTIFYYTEDKVHIGKLRSAMRRSLRTKVDLRQVGPRDVAKILEGFGACGRARCCVTFLTEFTPISIRMAKAQSISLNPSEITGVCGRLRCCLKYEYEQYKEAIKALPKKGKWVDTPHGQGKVIDLLPLENAAVVLIDDVRHTVPGDEVTVRRKTKPRSDSKTSSNSKGRRRDGADR